MPLRSPILRLGLVLVVASTGAIGSLSAQEQATGPKAAEPAAAGRETRTEKVELLRDGSVAESLARKIDVGFGSVRIDGEKSNVPLSSLTADQVLAAETTKVPTPDLDADAVGGLLQLTSRRTFEQPAPTLRASLGADYDALSGTFEPEVSATYGRAVGKRFGFVLTGSAEHGTHRGQGVDADWDSLGGRPALEEVMLRENRNTSDELAFNGLVDWKLGEKSAAQFRASVDTEKDRGSNRSLAYRLDDPLRPATSTSEVERVLQTHASTDLSYTFATTVAHKAERWELDLRLSRSRREDKAPDNRRYQFHQRGVGIDYAVIDPRFPRVTSRAGAQPDDPALFVLDEFQRSWRDRKETDAVGSIDLKLPKLPRWPAAWAKAGVKFRGLKTDRREANEVYGSSGLRLSEAPSDFRSDDVIGGRYALLAFPDAKVLRDIFAQRPDRFALDVEATRSDTDPANYHVQQEVTSAYLMAGIPAGRRVRVLAGGRMERTENRFAGYEVVFDGAGRYEATNPVGAKSAYTNWFPGLHALFAPAPGLEVFASWSRSIRRPAYGQLVPARRIDRASLEIYEGNPELRPTLYTNYDLAAEWAYHDTGRLALEGFHRAIVDTRLQRRVKLVGGLFDGYDRNRPENGGGARQAGFEVKWKQGLGPLGRTLRDFTLDGNYTFTDTVQQLENRPGERIPLTYEPKNLLTLQLAYERRGFFASVESNHRSTQLDSAGAEPAEDRFQPANTTWDVSLSYEFSRRWRAFLDVENLTEVPWQIYEGNRARVEDYWLEPRRFTFGVKWEM